MKFKIGLAAGLLMLGALTTPLSVRGDDRGNHQNNETDQPASGRGNRAHNQRGAASGAPSNTAPVGTAVVSGNGINYHNGSVLHTINLYYIWYGNWQQDPAANAILTHFGQNIGGSAYFNINTTYGDTTGNVPNAVTYKGSYTDSGTLGTSLSDANIATLVSNAIPSLGGPDPNGVYMVLTAPGVSETSGFLTQYCGWHSWGNFGSTPVQFAFIGDGAGANVGSCAAQTSASPNGDPAVDGMVSVMAHELEESATDPRGTGWYDSHGEENGDKCAWTFGTTYTANGAKANVALGAAGNTKNYLIQQDWVNANGGGCILTYEATPDFSAAVSGSQTIVAGGTSANYTLTATPVNGFSGTVSWAIQPPSGITATPAASGTGATFTLHAPLGLAAGTYSIPITATSGSLSHTLTATLIISAPGFTLSVSPSSQTVTRPGGGSVTTTFSISAGAVGAFGSPVALAVSGGSTGIAASVNPASINPGSSSTLTVTVSSSARRTSRSFTITGTSGGLSKIATATVNVQ